MGKGISAIISIVILLLITVGLAGTVFTYLTGYSRTLTSSLVEVMSITCNKDIATIYIKNTGTEPIPLPQSVQSQEYSPDANTVLLYHFDDLTCGPQSDQACDSSTNEFHGIIIGGPSNPDGKFGKALDFNGIDQNVYKSDDPLLSLTGKFTIESWVDISGIGEELLPIISKLPGNGRNGYGFYVDGNNDNELSFTFGYEDPPGTYTPFTRLSTDQVPSTGWQHVAVTFDPVRQAGEFFINGNSAGTFTYQNPMKTTNNFISIPVSLYPEQKYSNINVDEVRISNASRVFTSYMCTVSGSEAGCGELSLSKEEGEGAFGPGFDRKVINPGQVAILRDSCTSPYCTYMVRTATRVLPAHVQC